MRQSERGICNKQAQKKDCHGIRNIKTININFLVSNKVNRDIHVYIWTI